MKNKRVFKLEMTDNSLKVNIEASDDDLYNMFNAVIEQDKSLINPIIAGICEHISAEIASKIFISSFVNSRRNDILSSRE